MININPSGKVNPKHDAKDQVQSDMHTVYEKKTLMWVINTQNKYTKHDFCRKRF